MYLQNYRKIIKPLQYLTQNKQIVT